jgi:hypothetical protein
MKMRASSCYVCGRKYEPGEEYVQLEVESSKEFTEDPGRKHFLLVEANEEAIVYRQTYFLLSHWMRTSWVCLKCIQALPVEWQQVFSRPSLDEWAPVEQLGTHTYKVQKRDS